MKLSRHDKPARCVDVMLCVVVVAFLASQVLFGQDSGRRIRTIPEQPGVPIEQRLLPDDEIVVIQRWAHLDGIQLGNDPKNLIAAFTKFSELAVLADVQSVEAVFNSDRSWLTTKITATIDQVVRSRLSAPKRGTQIEVEYTGGGEVTIGQQTVRAGQPIKLYPGERHLLFLAKDPERGVLYPSGGAWVIRNGRLVNPYREADPKITDPVHGYSLEAAIKQIRAAAK
jgi:hypothetical protein